MIKETTPMPNPTDLKPGDVIEPVINYRGSTIHPPALRIEVVASCLSLARRYVESGAWRVVPKEELIETESYTNQNNPSLE